MNLPGKKPKLTDDEMNEIGDYLMQNTYEPTRESSTDRTKELETNRVRPFFNVPIFNEKGDIIGYKFQDGDVPFGVLSSAGDGLGLYSLFNHALATGYLTDRDLLLVDLKRDAVIESVVNSRPPGWLTPERLSDIEQSSLVSYLLGRKGYMGFERDHTVSTIHTEHRGFNVVKQKAVNLLNKFSRGEQQ